MKEPISRADRSNIIEETPMTNAIATTVVSPPQRRSFGELLSNDLRALPIVIGLMALWVFFALQSDVFLTPRNLSNLLVQSTVVGIMALGLMFVLLVKEIDLSVAAINGVTSVLMAKLIIEYGFSPWIAVPIAILIGAGVGSLSARWVTFVGVPSFVVTLGLGLALNGLQLILLPATARYSLNGTGLEKIALTNIAGPWAWVVLAIGIAVFAALVLSEVAGRKKEGLETPLLQGVVVPIAAATVLGIVVVGILNAHQGIPLVVLIFAVLLGIGGYTPRRPSSGCFSMPSATTTRQHGGPASRFRASRWLRSPLPGVSPLSPVSLPPRALSGSGSSPAAASAAARSCSSRSPRRSSAG
jgi:D-xylose transport system permease protein